jgi:acetyl/propionyl-CoA carboxylase alpha subunit
MFKKILIANRGDRAIRGRAEGTANRAVCAAHEGDFAA